MDCFYAFFECGWAAEVCSYSIVAFVFVVGVPVADEVDAVGAELAGFVEEEGEVFECGEFLFYVVAGEFH